MRYLTYQFHEYRQRRQAAHRWRQLQLTDWANCSFHRNDYLGLSQHPQVIAAFAQGLADYGCGSGGSPLVCGYQQPHHNLVRQLAEWLERDTAVLFSSGFAANQSALKALGALYDQLLLDRLCHASLLEGLGRRNWRRFPHNDVKAVRRLLKPGANLVITESVFSMDGDYAPLAELALLPTDLWVDDAHGIGLLGPDGRGAAALLPDPQAMLTIPFGKAIGVMGAALVGGRAELEHIVNSGREFIYSTAMPAAQAAAVSAAITILQTTEGERLRQQLQQRIALFQQLCQQYGIPLQASEHPIQTIVLGADEQALDWGKNLAEHVIACGVIRTPTVPVGTARLRITISALHHEDELKQLVEGMARCLIN